MSCVDFAARGINFLLASENLRLSHGEIPKSQITFNLGRGAMQMEIMEYYRDSNGFWRIKNFRRRRRARI